MSHAWSEVFVGGLGWTGFDAAHDICPQDAHVRVATGLDALAAAAVRGVSSETVTEDLDVSPLRVRLGSEPKPGTRVAAAEPGLAHLRV